MNTEGLCGARIRFGERCRQLAGLGTYHRGHGKCHLHVNGLSDPFQYCSDKTKEYGICRSPREFAVYQQLDKDYDVKEYIIEPYQNKIRYVFHGEAHFFTPDIRIKYFDRTKELVEIKSKYDFSQPQNIAKYKAAERFSQTREMKFNIWVCELIKTDRNKVSIKVLTVDEVVNLAGSLELHNQKASWFE